MKNCAICFTLRDRVRNVFRNIKLNKTAKTAKLLGTDWKTIKSHIENQFKEDMTWENHGKWHIDHIIPLASAKTEQAIFKLCHYTNLQPLWAIDNLKKKDKII